MSQKVWRFKVCLTGGVAVGKTSLLHRFVKGSFGSDYITTVGLDYLSKDIEVDNDLCKLVIWDIGRQERFKAYGKGVIKNFYRGSSGALLIFDLTNSDSFESVGIWHSEMMEALSDENEDVPFILVGNKLDVVMDTDRIIDVEIAEKFAEKHNSIYIEASAKTGENVEAAFLELIQRMMRVKD
jgi:small GTP-binding protein